MHKKDRLVRLAEAMAQDPNLDAEAFLKSVELEEAAAKAAPITTAPTTASTADAPKGGAGGMQKVLGLDRVTPAKHPRIPGTFAMPLDPNTGEVKSRVLDMLTAASPYLSPGGIGKSLISKAAAILLPTGAAVHEAFDPSSKGEQGEQVLGGAANMAREMAPKIPGVPPVLQAVIANMVEGGAGNVLNQAINKGSVDLGESAKSSGIAGAGGLLLNAPAVRGATANAVTGLENAMAGPLKEINTFGVVKPFTEMKNTLTGYLKAAPSYLTKAGLDRNTVRALRDDPNNTLDGLLDEALSQTTRSTPTIGAANETLGKIADLVAQNPQAKKELKEKTGEYLITKFMNPGGPRDFMEPLRELEKGGKSSLDKILSSEERSAFIGAMDDINTISRTRNLGKIRAGMTSNGFFITLLDQTYLLTPGHLATHILDRAQGEKAATVTKDIANYLRDVEKNPLKGGRLTRAVVEKFEKDLAKIGAVKVGEGQNPLVPERSEEPRPKSDWRDLFLGR